MTPAQIAQAHLDFDVAIEVAQDQLSELYKANHERFLETRAELKELVETANDDLDKATATYNIKIAAYRAAEEASRQALDQDNEAARTAYDEAIKTARESYRHVLHLVKEEG